MSNRFEKQKMGHRILQQIGRTKIFPDFSDLESVQDFQSNILLLLVEAGKGENWGLKIGDHWGENRVMYGRTALLYGVLGVVVSKEQTKWFS